MTGGRGASADTQNGHGKLRKRPASVGNAGSVVQEGWNRHKSSLAPVDTVNKGQRSRSSASARSAGSNGADQVLGGHRIIPELPFVLIDDHTTPKDDGNEKENEGRLLDNLFKGDILHLGQHHKHNNVHRNGHEKHHIHHNNHNNNHHHHHNSNHHNHHHHHHTMGPRAESDTLEDALEPTLDEKADQTGNKGNQHPRMLGSITSWVSSFIWAPQQHEGTTTNSNISGSSSSSSNNRNASIPTTAANEAGKQAEVHKDDLVRGGFPLTSPLIPVDCDETSKSSASHDTPMIISNAHDSTMVVGSPNNNNNTQSNNNNVKVSSDQNNLRHLNKKIPGAFVDDEEYERSLMMDMTDHSASWVARDQAHHNREIQGIIDESGLVGPGKMKSISRIDSQSLDDLPLIYKFDSKIASMFKEFIYYIKYCAIGLGMQGEAYDRFTSKLSSYTFPVFDGVARFVKGRAISSSTYYSVAKAQMASAVKSFGDILPFSNPLSRVNSSPWGKDASKPIRMKSDAELHNESSVIQRKEYDEEYTSAINLGNEVISGDQGQDAGPVPKNFLEENGITNNSTSHSTTTLDKKHSVLEAIKNNDSKQNMLTPEMSNVEIDSSISVEPTAKVHDGLESDEFSEFMLPTTVHVPSEIPGFITMKMGRDTADTLENPEKYLHISVDSVQNTCKKICIVACHGWYAPALEYVSRPEGTSARLATSMKECLLDFLTIQCGLDKDDCEKRIHTILLEHHGLVEDRVIAHTKALNSNTQDLNSLMEADVIFWVCHSQGVPVSVVLMKNLIEHEVIRPSKTKVSLTCLTGIGHGPYEMSIKTMVGNSGRQLFEFKNPQSKESTDFRKALLYILDKDIKLCAVGSWRDSVVPLFSAVLAFFNHKNIYRAMYLNDDDLRHGFFRQLISVLLLIRNKGYNDFGLLYALSSFYGGSFFSNSDGHSTIYKWKNTYLLGVIWGLGESYDHIQIKKIKHEKEKAKLEADRIEQERIKNKNKMVRPMFTAGKYVRSALNWFVTHAIEDHDCDNVVDERREHLKRPLSDVLETPSESINILEKQRSSREVDPIIAISPGYLSFPNADLRKYEKFAMDWIDAKATSDFISYQLAILETSYSNLLYKDEDIHEQWELLRPLAKMDGTDSANARLEQVTKAFRMKL